MKQQNWMQIQEALCLILRYYNLTLIKKILCGQTCGKWSKNIKTHLCAQLCPHVCQVLSCMAKNDWFFFSFPPLLLLLSYTVFCSGHSYHLWNHVWPWDSLGIHTAIRGGYEMVPKVQGTIHILRKHICFCGPLLRKHLFITENKQTIAIF